MRSRVISSHFCLSLLLFFLVLLTACGGSSQNSISTPSQTPTETLDAYGTQFIILTEDPAYGGNVSAVYKRANSGSIDALKLHQVYRINSNIIGRPGPRLVQGLQCLAQIIRPDKFSGALLAYCTGTV